MYGVRINVSILVFVELAFEANPQIAVLLFKLVSILVFVELAFEAEPLQRARMARY